MVSSVMIFLALPVMTLVALAIKLEDPKGPVFFLQTRIGENGRPFRIFKFRSMFVDADKMLDAVSTKDENGKILVHKRADDPRITRIGKIIRKTSLDEVPQLFNVLRGDMSLVGPRPELPRLVNEYETWQRQRFTVPQGITGWWQINGRSDNPCHLSTDQDLYYIQNYSFLLDVQILMMTVPALLKGKGAF
jgi:lipopolysaccharide/colanic/teichoic acid biosynthesis glycosyltransferase